MDDEEPKPSQYAIHPDCKWAERIALTCGCYQLQFFAQLVLNMTFVARLRVEDPTIARLFDLWWEMYRFRNLMQDWKTAPENIPVYGVDWATGTSDAVIVSLWRYADADARATLETYRRYMEVRSSDTAIASSVEKELRKQIGAADDVHPKQRQNLGRGSSAPQQRRDRPRRHFHQGPRVQGRADQWTGRAPHRRRGARAQ